MKQFKLFMFTLVTLFVTMSVSESLSSAYAQDSTAVVQNQPEGWVEATEAVGGLVVNATQSIYDGVKTAINDIAKALEVPATYVYKVLIKQQVVRGLTWLSFLLIPLFFTIFGVYLSIKNNDPTEKNFNNKQEIGTVISIIAGLVLIIVSLFTLDIITTGLINPDYGAIKEILKFVKQ